MNVRDVSDSTPSIHARISELLTQSRHHQTELARITEELDRLQCQIRDIGCPKNTDVTTEERKELRA